MLINNVKKKIISFSRRTTNVSTYDTNTNPIQFNYIIDTSVTYP